MTEPTGLSGATDAQLVAGVLAADREAFAAVYDRYGDRLFDFAHSMLRHREDAADAVADSFVLVAERLHQLRDPERLRPWLYAVVRSECLRRLTARKRIAFGGDEQLVAMADDSLTPDQEAERTAARQIVWDAAAGLAERDRALLDLHLRHGLEGAELGEAMGVTASHAYVLMNRLRGQVDRSLGALLIARLGRDDCADLDGVLDDWDGTFSPLVRKRVARHVDDCDVCSRRRTKILSPWMLLAGVPMVAAPLSLRDRVVVDTRLVAHTAPGGPGPGVPPAPPSRGPRRRMVRRGAAVAAAVVIVVGGTAAVLQAVGAADDSESSSDVVVADPTPGVAPADQPVTDQPVTPEPSPTISASPSVAAPTAVVPGSLTLSTRSISLGGSGSTATLRLTNDGGEAVSFRVTSGDGWLSVSRASGRVEPGATSRLTVRADRRQVTEGRSTGRLVVVWDTGRAAVDVSLVEERPPVVARPTTVASPSCSVPVMVDVSDDSGLSSVTLRWSGPSGPGSVAMSRSGTGWGATMGPFSVGGDVTFNAVATDTRGNVTAGPSTTRLIDPCPQ